LGDRGRFKLPRKGMSIGIEAVGFTKSIDANKVYKAIYRDLKRYWKEACQIFVESVASQIHVDTGMSLGSILPVAEELRMKTRFLQAMRGFGPSKSGHTKAYGPFADNNGLRKSYASGVKLGRRAYELKYGTHGDPGFVFTFLIKVLQYYLHENGLATGGAWNTMIEGEKAMLVFLESKVEEYLDLDEVFGTIFGSSRGGKY